MGAFADIDLPVDIPKLASLSAAMVRKALQAFIEGDAELAPSPCCPLDQVDEMNDAAFYALSTLIQGQAGVDAAELECADYARNLERVGDHATNIAEDVIFWVRGKDVRHNVGVIDREQSAGRAPTAGSRRSPCFRVPPVERRNRCVIKPEAELCGRPVQRAQDARVRQQLRRVLRALRSQQQSAGRALPPSCNRSPTENLRWKNPAAPGRHERPDPRAAYASWSPEDWCRPEIRSTRARTAPRGGLRRSTGKQDPQRTRAAFSSPCRLHVSANRRSERPARSSDPMRARSSAASIRSQLAAQALEKGVNRGTNQARLPRSFAALKFGRIGIGDGNRSCDRYIFRAGMRQVRQSTGAAAASGAASPPPQPSREPRPMTEKR